MARKVKLKISARLLRKKSRKSSSGLKNCRFCANKDNEKNIDYKNSPMLKSFLTERGKILPSRISANCAKHQRMVSGEIKKSRIMALLPYCAVSY